MCRFLFGVAMLVYCAIFPLLYYFGPKYSSWFDETDLTYSSIMYYLVFNTVCLVGFGYCAVGSIAYPYSNSYFNKS